MAAPADGLADFLLTAGAGAGGLNIARVAISNQATRRRRRVEAAMIAGGWAAMAAAFWFNPVWDARPPTQLWGAVLVVATGVGTVMALVAIDVVYVWRSSAARFD